jgi:hypothetical protein
METVDKDGKEHYARENAVGRVKLYKVYILYFITVFFKSKNLGFIYLLN